MVDIVVYVPCCIFSILLMCNSYLYVEFFTSVGIAHVCLVTSCMTIVRSKIDVTIPRKRKGNCSQHDKVFVMYLMALKCILSPSVYGCIICNFSCNV